MKRKKEMNVAPRNIMIAHKEFSFKNYNLKWAKRKEGMKWLYRIYIHGAFTKQRKEVQKLRKSKKKRTWVRFYSIRYGGNKFSCFSKKRINGKFFVFPISRLYVPVFTLQQIGLHIGSNRSKWNQKNKSYLMGRRFQTDIFDMQFAISSFRHILSYVKSIRKCRALFHHVGTREDTEYRFGVRDMTKYYARISSSYHTGSKWLGGTLTNIRQKTLLQNFHTHRKVPNIPSEFKWYERWQASHLYYKYPDFVTLFDAIEEEYGIKDTKIMSIPSLVSIDTYIDRDDCFYALCFSHMNNSALHFYHKMLMKPLKISNRIRNQRFLLNLNRFGEKDVFKEKCDNYILKKIKKRKFILRKDFLNKFWLKIPGVSNRFLRFYSKRMFFRKKGSLRFRKKHFFFRLIRNLDFFNLVEKFVALSHHNNNENFKNNFFVKANYFLQSRHHAYVYKFRFYRNFFNRFFCSVKEDLSKKFFCNIFFKNFFSKSFSYSRFIKEHKYHNIGYIGLKKHFPYAYNFFLGEIENSKWMKKARSKNLAKRKVEISYYFFKFIFGKRGIFCKDNLDSVQRVRLKRYFWFIKSKFKTRIKADRRKIKNEKIKTCMKVI